MQSSPPTELAAKALPQFPGSSNEDLHSTSRSFPREGTMALSTPSSPLPPSLTKLIKPWWKGEQRIYRWQNIDFCSSRTTGRRWRTPQKLCEVWDTGAISVAVFVNRVSNGGDIAIWEMSRSPKIWKCREMRLQSEVPVSTFVVPKPPKRRGTSSESSLPPGGPVRHCSESLRPQLTVSKAFINHISSVIHAVIRVFFSPLATTAARKNKKKKGERWVFGKWPLILNYSGTSLSQNSLTFTAVTWRLMLPASASISVLSTYKPKLSFVLQTFFFSLAGHLHLYWTPARCNRSNFAKQNSDTIQSVQIRCCIPSRRHSLSNQVRLQF